VECRGCLYFWFLCMPLGLGVACGILSDFSVCFVVVFYSVFFCRVFGCLFSHIFGSGNNTYNNSPKA
jgi:hypothetical protein